MSEPFIGEIRAFGFNFAPRDWAFCDGTILAIASNTALFAVIGNAYGGNGTTTFALPNLMGNAVMSQGTGPGLPDYVVGEELGVDQVTLLSTQIPTHTHQLQGATVPGATQRVAAPTTAAMLSASSPNQAYSTDFTPVMMAPQAIGVTGNSLPHNNVQPRLAMNYCIALYGIFPPHQ